MTKLETFESRLERIDPYWWLKGPKGSYVFGRLSITECWRLFSRVKADAKHESLAYAL